MAPAPTKYDDNIVDDDDDYDDNKHEMNGRFEQCWQTPYHTERNIKITSGLDSLQNNKVAAVVCAM